ncbi:MAG: DUF1194 domain-containing protein [Alphaproteobacteria bacterium]|nr:DUF1194 domain-containing protein [Alphaproteobacteria bacterium]
MRKSITAWTGILALTAWFFLQGPMPALAQSDAAEAPEYALPVDVELVIAADGSGSISDMELAVQREGYAAAITDPRVLSVIQSGSIGRLAVAYIEWGGADSQEVIADWHLIEDAASAAAFAEVIRETPRKAYGWNSISNAIWKAAEMLEGNAYEGTSRVIDVSGDAGQRGGRPLPLVREFVLSLGITINGLALDHRGGGLSGPGGMPLALHYQRDIIGGPGSFVMTVKEPEGFHEAILEKLILEIAGRTPDPERDLGHTRWAFLFDGAAR